MSSFLDKMMHMIGFEEEDDENIPAVEEEISSSRKKKGNNNVVSLHAQKQMKVIVIEPMVFEDALEVAEALKSRRSVIVNMENADVELARRILDFTSGIAYAVEGGMQKVGTGIFLFTPSNVDISPESKFDGDDKMIFPWKQ